MSVHSRRIKSILNIIKEKNHDYRPTSKQDCIIFHNIYYLEKNEINFLQLYQKGIKIYNSIKIKSKTFFTCGKVDNTYNGPDAQYVYLDKKKCDIIYFNQYLDQKNFLGSFQQS